MRFESAVIRPFLIRAAADVSNRDFPLPIHGISAAAIFEVSFSGDFFA